MKRMVILIIAILCLCFGLCLSGCTHKCDACNGSGEVVCGYCNGEDDVECPVCKGVEGKLNECLLCDGKGYTEEKTKERQYCPDCHGDGTIFSTIKMSDDAYQSVPPYWDNPCTTCDASGYVNFERIECDSCGGDGYDDYLCIICDGKGHGTCPFCSGTGMLSCKKCNGTGKIED